MVVIFLGSFKKCNHHLNVSQHPNKIKVQFILHLQFSITVFSVRVKARRFQFLVVSANMEQKEISHGLYPKEGKNWNTENHDHFIGNY